MLSTYDRCRTDFQLSFRNLLRPPGCTLFPYTTLFRSARERAGDDRAAQAHPGKLLRPREPRRSEEHTSELSHLVISYAVFCLKKKKRTQLLVKTCSI